MRSLFAVLLLVFALALLWFAYFGSRGLFAV